jgi:hypothetical protein
MRSEVAEFGEFVSDMELVDLPVLGRKFTWFHPNGVTMSRIDRVLVNDDWLSLWSNPSLWILPRSVSDHCARIIRYVGFDWGPKPFRFNNHWLLNKDFHGVVEEFWRNCHLTGWIACILKEKLKGLKTHLRGWNKATYGQLDFKINEIVEDIKELDMRSELVGLSANEVIMRKKLFGDMWHYKISKESPLMQRSRQTWLREGDSNTKFFHTVIKSRGKRNHISALLVGDTWLDSPCNPPSCC